jgi:Zinc finger, C2H2 type
VNPRVVLDRLEADVTEFDLNYDPFLCNVKLETSMEQETIVKFETAEEPDLTFPETWVFQDNSKMLIKSEENFNPRNQARKSNIKSPKRRNLDSNAKNLKFDGISQTKQISEKCSYVRCKFMIHPKLKNEHMNLFHRASSKESLKMSLLESVKSNRKICPYCAKLYSKTSYSDHVSSFTPLHFINCNFVKKFNTFHFFMQITKHHHRANAKYMYCDLCGFKTTIKIYLKKHFAFKHILKPQSVKKFQCSMCPKKFSQKNYVQIHENRIHSQINEKHRCDDCGKFYKTPQSLQHHIQSIHENLNLPCSQCKKTFKTKLHLKNHVLSQHSEKVTCETCGKLISQGPLLAYHKWSHLKKVCPFEECGKIFSIAQFNHHIESHQKPQNLPCPFCSTTCPTRHSLKTHIYNQHKREELKCKVIGCNYSVRRKLYLKEHYMRHKDISEKEKDNLIRHLNETLCPIYNSVSFEY